MNGEYRFDGLTPAFGRHGVTQAFGMPPDQRRRVWRKKLVRDRCAGDRQADICGTKPCIQFGIPARAGKLAPGYIGSRENEELPASRG